MKMVVNTVMMRFRMEQYLQLLKLKKDMNANKLKDNTLGVSNPEKALAKLAQVTLKKFYRTCHWYHW